VKASAKVYRISFTTKCFEEYFSKIQKSTKALIQINQKQHQTYPYHSPGSHKNKNSNIKTQNKKEPLKRKIENKRSFNFSQNNKYLQ